MARASYGVLVHYPSGRSDVRVVPETPAIGALLTGAEGVRWLMTGVRLREGELDGKAYTTEVQVEPAPKE
jgi:hypothetical protein